MILGFKNSSTWWKGALKGAAKGLLLGVAVGIGSALLFQAAFSLGLFGSAASLFQGFLTLEKVATVVVPWSAFSVVPFSMFSGVSGLLTGLLRGGSDAVNAQQQRMTNELTEAKLNQLDYRTQALEQSITPSHRVQKILGRGPNANYQSAEEARVAERPTDRTIH